MLARKHPCSVHNRRVLTDGLNDGRHMIGDLIRVGGPHVNVRACFLDHHRVKTEPKGCGRNRSIRRTQREIGDTQHAHAFTRIVHDRCTGDLVLADSDGVVVVPQEVERDALADAWRKVHDENKTRDAIRNGMSAVEAYERFGVL